MPLAALEKLPPAQPRKFVPEALDLGDWTRIEPLFQALEAAAARISSAGELEAWLYRASELGAALYQEKAKRYINMTCQTDDLEAERAHLHYVEKIEPRTKSLWQKLDRLYLESPYRTQLPEERWAVFDRDTQKDVEIFRAENVPLQTEEAKLSQRYQKRMGAMTVTFQGREQTLQEMGKYQEEPLRALREEAWIRVTERRLQDRAALEELYEELLARRGRIARNAGFENYRDYAFRAKGRFDYTPRMCEAFHAAVEALVAPLARALQKRRQRQLGVAPLRPWDLSADPKGRPPLRPFTDTATLIGKTHEIFRRIAPELGADFNVLLEHQLLDLESRKGKAPGGYQYTLEEARLPFIFMNAVGQQRDVETLLHEGGHAFHALATRNEPLLPYRHAPLEFCEVASMTMELLAGPHLEVFYAKPEEAARARRKHLEGIVTLLPWIATIDAFQHWIYTHEGHTRSERKTHWLSLRARFGGIEDWSGHEEAQARLWHRQGHLFGAPFYYIEYGIAQLGALQIWRNAQADHAQAIARYRAALALGRSRPLPELFQAAGASFDFSAPAMQPLVEALREELQALEEV